ncbi:hypothetical protein [Streptomyces hundungensis]|uniref:hypothetical protein n=1 Tax=Streptomyces hundungensis TaxID=1077946 RepID=UPI0013C525F5|nr:hypothetical protein [Streptomyces hundungensis]
MPGLPFVVVCVVVTVLVAVVAPLPAMGGAGRGWGAVGAERRAGNPLGREPVAVRPPTPASY